MNEKQKTYSVPAICLNCGYRGNVDIPRGIEKPARKTCPNCGYFTYILSENHD